MRFFSSFSRIHHKSKSECAIDTHPHATANIHPWSQSAPQLKQLVRVDQNANIRDAFSSPATFYSLNTFPPPPMVMPADTSESTTSARRILYLESQLAELKGINRRWFEQYGELELSNMENYSNYFIAMGQASKAMRASEATQAANNKLEKKLAEYDKFLSRLIDVGLHELVLDKAHARLRKGENADDAFVDAIKEAAAKPGSEWARIFPAIIGPRTPEAYVSAINMTLKLRQELKESKRVASFWKLTAKEGGEHADTFTPSSISGVLRINELPGERSHLVDDFVAKIHSTDWSTSRRDDLAQVIPTSCMLSPTPAAIEAPKLPPDLGVLSTPPRSKLIASLFEHDTTDPYGSLSTSPVDSHSARQLAFHLSPSTSESFHEDSVNLESNDRLSKCFLSSVKKTRRIVLGEVSKPCAKPTRKGKAIAMSQSIQSVQGSDFTYLELRQLPPPASDDPFTASTPSKDAHTSAFTKSLLLSCNRGTNLIRSEHITVQTPAQDGHSRNRVSDSHPPKKVLAHILSLSAIDTTGGSDSNDQPHMFDGSDVNTRDISLFPCSIVYDVEQPPVVHAELGTNQTQNSVRDAIGMIDEDLEKAYDYNYATRDNLTSHDTGHLKTSTSQAIKHPVCLLTHNNVPFNKALLYGSFPSICAAANELAESTHPTPACDTIDHSYHLRDKYITTTASMAAMCDQDLFFVVDAAGTTPEKLPSPKNSRLPIMKHLQGLSTATSPVSEVEGTATHPTTPMAIRKQKIIPTYSAIKPSPRVASGVLASPPPRVSSIPIPSVSRNTSLLRPSNISTSNSTAIPAHSKLTLLSNTKAAGSRLAKRAVGRLSRIVS